MQTFESDSGINKLSPNSTRYHSLRGRSDNSKRDREEKQKKKKSEEYKVQELSKKMKMKD